MNKSTHHISRINTNLQVFPVAKINVFLQLQVSPEHQESDEGPDLNTAPVDISRKGKLFT